jgi:hypothetical protein
VYPTGSCPADADWAACVRSRQSSGTSLVKIELKGSARVAATDSAFNLTTGLLSDSYCPSAYISDLTTNQAS